MPEPATAILGLILYVIAPLALLLAPFALAGATTHVLTRRRPRGSRWRLFFASYLATALFLSLLHVLTLDGLDGVIFGSLTPNDTVWAPHYSTIGFLRVRAGMSMSQVEALVGPPLERYEASKTPALTGWRWSRSEHSNNHYCRVVLFKDGRVFQRHSEFYLD